jgi:periplasmic divalent cation tolerance protein
MNAISVYIPCPDKKTAESIAAHLLEKRLIGCSNIFPISSMYWWKGKIEKADEWVILGKTISKKYNDIVTETKAKHPYETPLIAKFEVIVNEDYGEWLMNSLGRK